jgi:hypothetical protein
MDARRAVTIALTIVAYIVSTFATQGTSHFAVNADFYATLPFMRQEPIVAMGLIAMIIQGSLIGALFPYFNRHPNTVRNAVVFSWAFGAFLASYILLGEGGKYAIPSLPAWFAAEGITAFAQFTIFGLLLGLVHRRAPRAELTRQTV